MALFVNSETHIFEDIGPVLQVWVVKTYLLATKRLNFLRVGRAFGLQIRIGLVLFGVMLILIIWIEYEVDLILFNLRCSLDKLPNYTDRGEEVGNLRRIETQSAVAFDRLFVRFLFKHSLSINYLFGQFTQLRQPLFGIPLLVGLDDFVEALEVFAQDRIQKGRHVLDWLLLDLGKKLVAF